MQDTDQQNSPHDDLEAKREIIRRLLNEIVDAVSTETHNAGLDFPIFMTVPNSGEALAGIAMALDPSDEDWDRTLAIVYRVIEKHVDCDRLWSQPLSCAVVNGAMSAVTVELPFGSEVRAT